MERIDAKTLHAWLLDGHELALLASQWLGATVLRQSYPEES